MTYIAAGAAILQLGATYMGMEAKKKASMLEGAEYDKTALETLLTGKWHIGNLRDSGFIQSISATEVGMDRKAMLFREGKKRTGKIAAALGGSGVKMDSGTAAQQLIKSGLDNAANILQNQESLDNALLNIQYQTEGAIEKTRIDTIMKYNKLKRMADMARKGGNAGQFTAMMGGLTTAASTYKSLGGDFTEFETGEGEAPTKRNTGPK